MSALSDGTSASVASLSVIASFIPYRCQARSEEQETPQCLFTSSTLPHRSPLTTTSNKLHDRVDDQIRKIDVWRVAAVAEDEGLDRSTDVLLDQVDLLERAIPIVLALNHQRRRRDLRQQIDDAPGAEGGAPPDLHPTAE